MEKNNEAVSNLLDKAKADLMENMKERDIAAIIWDLSEAGFPYLPEIELPDSTPEDPKTVRITGLYSYKGKLYIIEEDVADIDFEDFYNPDNEVKPVIVSLTPDLAAKYLGNPEEEKGYTTDGDLEEWLAIADCYFQALAEE